VFEDGGLVLNGTPEEIFREGGEMGLGVPKAAKIAKRLRALGVPLESDIFTAEATR
jgi:hypothetical protein